MYIPQKLITLKQFFDNFIEGFKDMVLVNGIIISAFVLQDINDELDLTNYVIDKTLPLLSPAVFPAIIFFLIAVIAFATGSFWGVAAIAFPIVIPMAVELDVNLFMGIGAIVSGAAFGSHSCFFGDMTTLVCASTEIKNIDYARTSIPLILVPFALSLIAFLVVGSIMA